LARPQVACGGRLQRRLLESDAHSGGLLPSHVHRTRLPALHSEQAAARTRVLTCGSGPRAAQDYEIACPQTGTTFSLKTGEITAWCRPRAAAVANTRRLARCMSAVSWRPLGVLRQRPLHVSVKRMCRRGACIGMGQAHVSGTLGQTAALWGGQRRAAEQAARAGRYPSNPVLRLITPQETCRNLDVYPVKLTQDAILIDVEGAANTRFQARARALGMRCPACNALHVLRALCAFSRQQRMPALQGRAVLAGTSYGAKQSDH